MFSPIEDVDRLATLKKNNYFFQAILVANWPIYFNSVYYMPREERRQKPDAFNTKDLHA